MIHRSYIAQSAPEEALFLLNAGEEIGGKLAYDAMNAILEISDEQQRNYLLTAILCGLNVKGPTKEESVGLLEATFVRDGFSPLRRQALPASTPTIMYAGSGKKGIKTVNISSLATLVAACSDVTIAKLCSHSTSSMTGSQDFIELLGANIKMPTEEMMAIASELHMGYFPVEDMLPKFAKVYNGIFRVPHALSYAHAALVMSFATDRVFYGLAHPNLSLSLEILDHYHIPQATVINSTADRIHYADEALGIGVTSLARHSDNRTQETISLDINNLTGRSPEEIMEAIAQESSISSNIQKGLLGLINTDSVLSTQIAVNAALLQVNTYDVVSIHTAYTKSLDIIKSGQPIQKLRDFIRTTGGDTKHLERLLI